MFRVEDSNRFGVLSDLLSSSVSTALTKQSDEFVQIKSMQATCRQLARTPETLRIMMQLEFNFDGVVDSSKLDAKTANERAKELLTKDWWKTNFVVIDYSRPSLWMQKIVDEYEAGKLIVALVPARTNTNWFHKFVLGYASEVRYIKGVVQLTNATKPNTFPDCIVVFDPQRPGQNWNNKDNDQSIDRPKEDAKKVAVLRLNSSFTSTGAKIEAVRE